MRLVFGICKTFVTIDTEENIYEFFRTEYTTSIISIDFYLNGKEYHKTYPEQE